MIRLGLKGLADFITGSPPAQRKTLRDYKYPDDDEAKARSSYYREARKYIRAYHAGTRSSSWLAEQSAELRAAARGKSRAIQIRLWSNARALDRYARSFADKQLEPLEELRLRLHFGAVEVRVTPDLHVRERKRERIIRLEFAEPKPSQDRDRFLAIMGQMMFEGAACAGLQVSSADVLCYDLPGGVTRKGARVGSRIRAEIDAACQTIEAVWPTL